MTTITEEQWERFKETSIQNRPKICPFMSRPVLTSERPSGDRWNDIEVYEANCRREACAAWSYHDDCCWLIFGNNILDVQRNGMPVVSPPAKKAVET